MVLDGDGFILRPWRPGDEAALVRHGNHREVWRNLTDRFPHPYRLADAREWIALQAAVEPAENFAIVVEGEALGGIGFARQADLARRCAEIGYWLGPSAWGRGLATRALELCTQYAFAHFDFERLEAGVLAWNPASCRVLEKCGYALEGVLRRGAFKDGEVVDRHLYSRLRES